MKKFLKTFVFMLLSVLLLTVALSANRLTVRSGETTANSMMSDTENGSETYAGNIDSGSDGHIDGSADGKDAQSPIPNAVESVVDGAITDVSDAVNSAENAVNDATDGNMWGILIAILIIGGLAAVLFVILKKK